jgi:FAD/FMN-containing dehydrogenase/Fe-S oxidoreductase
MTVSAREIPFNYTSADDQQVVTVLLGADAWARLEALREQRVTGRSARLLLRFMGEAWLLKRNPFLFQELVDDAGHRRRFIAACQQDLDLVAQGAGSNQDVKDVVGLCRDLLRQLIVQIHSTPKRQSELKSVLGAVVGKDNVLCDPFSLISHATDATDWRLFLPLAVVFPVTEAQVAPLLKAIGEMGLKAIPRGAGTGLTGGAVPVMPDCVMVNTERLDHQRGIRTEDLGAGLSGWVLEAEAGTVTENAIQAAAKQGLVFATDPTSSWACTLGGNLAENAGGKTAVLWGTAIDNVLRWTIALADGRACRVRRLDHPLRKITPDELVRWEVRFDGEAPRVIEMRGDQIRKRGLWKDITNKALGGLPGIQKEGTDGVITSCAFVLHEAYPEKATACLEFFGPDMKEASQVILGLSQAFPNRGAETLQALEHFDDEYITAIDYKVKAAREGRPKAVLLVDLVGRDPGQVQRGLATLRALLAAYPDSELFIAKDKAEAQVFWADRKKFGAIAKRTNAFKLNEDVVLPLDRLADFAAFIDGLNLGEERHNHGLVVERLKAWALALKPAGNEAWAAAKAPAVERLCAAATAAWSQADREGLRQGLALKRLLAGLEEVYTGVPGLLDEARKVHAEERGRLVVIATHMHAGDGNVHVNIPVFSNDRGMMRRASEAADTVMRRAVALGGAVSGEHGIGITKVAHLGAERLAELKAHRARLDPQGLMNPGKLDDPTLLERCYTPSFNLLNLEARILQHDQLEVLAKKIQTCVRCGKCKPDCCVFSPAQALFYHPRNKNLAIGGIIEALLYDAQRSHGERYDVLRHLQDVADHCTMCHKCLAPCPVDIDTGEVSLLERQILKARKYKRTPLAVELSLSYLGSRSPAYRAVFRSTVLKMGIRAQRLGSRLTSILPSESVLRRTWPLSLVARPLPLPSEKTLPELLPAWGERQALVLAGPNPSGKAVFYFPGCGSERLYGEVGQGALYTLLKAGATVVLPPPAMCCGFPFGANGKVAEKKRIELKNAIVFSQIKDMLSYLSFDAIAFSCGTCMEALDHLGAAAVFQAPLKDAAGWALEQGLKHEPLGPSLYHKPCHDSLKGQALKVIEKAGGSTQDVPACCGEAGTLALSRPDIGGKLFDRKEFEIKQVMAQLPKEAQGQGPIPMLTNCPACLQGLGRQEKLGIKVQHLAVAIAEKAEPQWKRELKAWAQKAEVVTF